MIDCVFFESSSRSINNNDLIMEWTPDGIMVRRCNYDTKITDRNGRTIDLKVNETISWANLIHDNDDNVEYLYSGNRLFKVKKCTDAEFINTKIQQEPTENEINQLCICAAKVIQDYNSDEEVLHRAYEIMRDYA